jgi:hypothetical protein
VILHRAGRRGIWPTFPWVLAIVCGPIYGVLSLLIAHKGYLPGDIPLGLLASWASGAYISICLSLVIFAIIGIAPKPES